MQLGAFSISLAVKDIEKSRKFYEKLGFELFGGEPSQNWLIMKNGRHVIGLFQGMFEENILTFNPGWDQEANQLDSFDDVRRIYEELKNKGVTVTDESNIDASGPASFAVMDPDGNQILFDQHV